jgi:MFS transporter, DHA1 family, multidrug resistance protein
MALQDHVIQNMTNKRQTYIIFILGLLACVSPFAIDMYLPGFPAIARDLETSIDKVQLSLTSYFIGIAAGQLLYGPLLDRFGRKRPLYVGLTVYLIASVMCAYATSAEGLIAVRFVQALGGCVGMVAAQALVRDIFPVGRIAQVFSWITLVVAISPMIAPTVGGYLTAAYGWQSVFIALAIVTALILALAYFVLPAGNRPDENISLMPKAVVKNFYGVSTNPQFLLYCLAGGFASSAPFAFIAGSSDVFINIFGSTEREYGWIFAMVGAVMIGCTQMNHVLLRKFKSDQVVLAAMSYQLVVGFVLIVFAVTGWMDKTSLVVLSVMFVAAHGLSNANTTALSLAPFTKNTGSAASLLGTFRMTMGAIVSAFVSFFHNGSIMPMVITMVMTVVVGFIILVSGRAVIRFRLRNSSEEESSVVL